MIVLTTFDLDEYAFGALRAGASAFLVKTATHQELVDAVRDVARGDAIVTPRITRQLIDAYTGRDQPVIAFLDRQPEAQRMRAQIAEFIRSWLGALAEDHRSYVTVAIGCTGGQHRSVYLVEKLAEEFATQWTTLKRHRELDK